VLQKLKDVYPYVLGVNLRANAQLQTQLLSIVSNQNADYVQTLNGPGDLIKLIPWIMKISCILTPPPSQAPATTGAPKDYHNCHEWYLNGYQTSGVYKINISNALVDVFCVMKTQTQADPEEGWEEGGYTTFLSRDNKLTNFNRTWQEYVDGFGQAAMPQDSHWLGLENIYWLTNNYRMKMRVELERCQGERDHAEYADFIIGPASTRYSVRASGFDLTNTQLCDAFNTASGGRDNYCPFATPDRYSQSFGAPDCIALSLANCREYLYGGWWFGGCQSNLNGHYFKPADDFCIVYDRSGIHWCVRNTYYVFTGAWLTLKPHD